MAVLKVLQITAVLAVMEAAVTSITLVVQALIEVLDMVVLVVVVVLAAVRPLHIVVPVAVLQELVAPTPFRAVVAEALHMDSRAVSVDLALMVE
jgi:hypothetical protein